MAENVAEVTEVSEVSYTGTALEPFIQSIKHKIQSKEPLNSYLFEAPNPTISSRERASPASSLASRFSPPSVDAFKSWGCTILVLSWQTFFPEHVPEKFICVRGCKKATVVRNGWYSKLVRALGLQRPLFILTQDYRCKDCHAKPDGRGGYGSTLYLAHKEDILGQLLAFIKNQLPIVFTETGVPVERSLQDLVHFLAPEAVGFPAIARLIKELHTVEEKRRKLVYYEYQLELKHKREQVEEKRRKGIARFFNPQGNVSAGGIVEPDIQTWAMGRRVPDWVAGAALLSAFFLQMAAAKLPVYRRQMALVTGEFLAVDHCHKLMKRIRGLEGQKVLDATLTVITDTGEVATSLWSHSTSLDVVKDNLRQLYKRFLKRGCRPRVLYCDWPEVMGPFFAKLWPLLEACQMDILHAMMRVTKHVPDDHLSKGWFQGSLSDQIFVKNQAHLAEIVRELESKGKMLADKTGKNALRRCRKSVPPPEILLSRLQELDEEASTKVDPLTGEPLLGPDGQRAWQGLLHQARQGLLSDPPNTEMYYVKPGRSPTAKPQYGCRRGSSRQEGFHTHFQAILSGNNSSAELAWGVASTFLNRWNTKSRQGDRGETDYGTYNLELLYEIGVRMEALHLAPVYRDVQFTMEETEETFGVQCTPSGLREVAAMFQEGELAPSHVPEIADDEFDCDADDIESLVNGDEGALKRAFAKPRLCSKLPGAAPAEGPIRATPSVTKQQARPPTGAHGAGFQPAAPGPTAVAAPCALSPQPPELQTAAPGAAFFRLAGEPAAAPLDNGTRAPFLQTAAPEAAYAPVHGGPATAPPGVRKQPPHLQPAAPGAAVHRVPATGPPGIRTQPPPSQLEAPGAAVHRGPATGPPGIRTQPPAVRYAATAGPHRARLNATFPHHRR